MTDLGSLCRFRLTLALAICLTVAAVTEPQAQSTRRGAEPPGIADAVAVLPFVNISGTAADDWIGRGIAETVTADLDRLGTLAVVGSEAVLERESVIGGGATGDEATSRIGRALDVRWVVAGGFQRAGDRVRVTVRVVDVGSGHVAHSATIDGTIADLFSLQDRIVAELGQRFEPFAGGGRTLRRESRREPEAAAPSASAAAAASARRGPADRTRLEASGAAGKPAGLGILAGRPIVRPRRTDAPPEIDGRLDDDVWRTATVITELVQQSPLDGAPATEETEVYLAYDSDHLYFGFYLHYEDPGIMRANRVDRDRAWQDDLITVYLDTFMSQQRCYDFDVNAYNVQGDGIINTGGFSGGDGGGAAIPNPDRSWDTLFYSGAQIVEDGYTAEMAIPFKSIRYPEQPSGAPHRWGFQIVREIKAKNAENAVWAPMSRGISGFMAQMGVLEGMTDLSTSRNLEILPTFTAIKFGSFDDTTGGFVDRGTTPEAGVNLKYGITSNLTADLAFNPDFSQIESDLAQINVNQRFPLFFSELRPFFLEGQEIFDFTSPVNLVHTRTIVDPNVGGKLTGKVGRTTLGVLVADDEAPGKRDSFDAGFGQTAQVVIGRAKYDLYAESHIGAIVTDREFLDGYSRVGGVDGQFRLGQTSRFNFVAVQSTHRDEAGRERSGPMGGALVQHNGRNLTAQSFVGIIDPDFRTDVGFVRRVDQRLGGVSVGYRWWPESWLISWGPEASYQLSYNHEGIREDESLSMGVNLELAKNIGLGADTNRLLERFGGIDFHRTNYNVFSNVNTSRLFSLGGGFTWGDEIFYDPANPYLGRASSARLFANLRPIPRLSSQINVTTSRFSDVRSGGVEVFNIKLFRALTTFTFTDRLLIRNITEYNSFAKTLALNVLATYRINALTVFYVGYDDHYQQADQLYDEFFPGTELRRTNRAFFTKLQYLFRH